MRSFAIIAGLAASVQAAAYGYPAYNASSAVETPVYETTEVPSYETPAPVSSSIRATPQKPAS
jgi:hypothetical protein